MDPVLAKQVAALSTLKATVSGVLQDESPDIDLPQRQALSWLPWVASFVWVLAGAAVLLALTLRTDWMLPGPGLTVAEQVHLTWLQAGALNVKFGLMLDQLTVIMFVVVTQTVFSFQVFVPVYVMTKGGPLDATKVIVYYIYQFGFLFQDMGYASALSIVTLVILLIVSVIQMRIFRSDVEY